MIHKRKSPALRLETPQDLAALEGVLHDFESDQTAERNFLDGEIHQTHAAFA
jgi:hypothetical protein